MAKKKFRFFKPRAKKLNRSVAGNGLLFFIMAICGFFMALPLVMIINNCLKPLDEIYQYPPRILVRNPTLETFFQVHIEYHYYYRFRNGRPCYFGFPGCLPVGKA